VCSNAHIDDGLPQPRRGEFLAREDPDRIDASIVSSNRKLDASAHGEQTPPPAQNALIEDWMHALRVVRSVEGAGEWSRECPAACGLASER
jgi:hypothetical protein